MRGVYKQQSKTNAIENIITNDIHSSMTLMTISKQLSQFVCSFSYFGFKVLLQLLLYMLITHLALTIIREKPISWGFLRNPLF
jgi:hypothetical protein